MELGAFHRALLIVEAENATLEESLAEARARTEDAEQKSADARRALHAQASRIDEADAKARDAAASAEALVAARKDDTKRHEMRLDMLQQQATADQRKMREQAQELHALREALRAAEIEITSLRAYKNSTEPLAADLEKKVAEVLQLAEAVNKGKQAALASIAAVAAEQRQQASAVAACLKHHQQMASCAGLRKELKKAHVEKAVANELAKEHKRTLEAAMVDLDTARAAASDKALAARSARDESSVLETRLGEQSRLIAEQSAQTTLLMQRGVKISESYEMLLQRNVRAEVANEILVRELTQLDADTSIHAELGSNDDKMAVLEIRALQSRLVDVEAELEACTRETATLSQARARAEASLAEKEDTISHLQVEIQARAAVAALPGAHPPVTAAAATPEACPQASALSAEGSRLPSAAATVTQGVSSGNRQRAFVAASSLQQPPTTPSATTIKPKSRVTFVDLFPEKEPAEGPICKICDDVVDSDGPTTSCAECGTTFHASCCGRNAKNCHKKYECAECTPHSRKRSKAANSTISLMQRNARMD